MKFIRIIIAGSYSEKKYMFRRNLPLRVSSQWPETVGAAMARKRPKTNQTDLEAEAAAQAAQSTPSVWQQFWESDIVTGAQDIAWTKFGLGAADVGLHGFSFFYMSLHYYDGRSRFGKSRFTAMKDAFIEWLPYWIVFWFLKKYYAYIMDVPVERNGVSSTSSSRFIPTRRSVQGMNDETGEMEFKESHKSQMRQDTELYESKMREKISEKSSR